MRRKRGRLIACTLILALMMGTWVEAKGNGTVQLINSVQTEPKGVASPPLINLMNGLFSQLFTPDMTKYDQVKACYDWLIQNTEYGFCVVAPQDAGLEFTTYAEGMAYMVIKNHFGDCIGYSIAFAKMQDAIGVDCYVQYGLTSKKDGSHTTHAWVVAVIDGREYIFDPQIEDNIAKGGNIGYYRFCKEYGEVPGKYLTGEAALQCAYSENFADFYNIWLAGVMEQENRTEGYFY